MFLIVRMLIILASSIIFVACGDKADLSTPAQSSIDEYSSKLEECADKKEEPSENSEEAAKKVAASKNPASPFDLRKEDIIMGNPNSLVVMIEYFSPTCPHCAYFHANTFPEIKKRYIDTGKIAYVTREFIGNKQDLDAAVLARCPKNSADFDKLMSVILSQQDSWATNNKYKEILTNIGQLGGISPEQYASCLNDDALAAFLISNTQMVAKLPKFVGTPAFFINETYFNNPYTLEALSASIEEALSNQAPATENGK